MKIISHLLTYKETASCCTKDFQFYPTVPGDKTDKLFTTRKYDSQKKVEDTGSPS